MKKRLVYGRQWTVLPCNLGHSNTVRNVQPGTCEIALSINNSRVLISLRVKYSENQQKKILDPLILSRAGAKKS
jgi:hypothetical protein